MAATVEPGLQAGALFEGRYQIVGEIGAGTFSRVYRARQLSTGQDVALKLVAPRAGASEALDSHVERLRREMRLCIALVHPNIVRLVDSGESESGAIYAAFEYVPGATLKQVLLDEGKLSLRETIHLMSQVLDALSCAHAQGIVHRDLKPENIIVTATGARRNAMVLDFGLSGFAPAADGWGLPRITATQEMMGTPCYAAPEQLRGEPPTTRSDLYSWGLIFIECLTGELAVQGASVHEAILKQLNDEPIPIPILPSARLRGLLAAVTVKPVERRTATIEGLLHALSVVESGAALEEDEDVEPQRLRDGERRQVTLVACRARVTCRDGQRLDLEQLDELLHAQYARYGELAGRAGGQVASAFGDRAMLVFGYPQAHEDDARRAARTALALVADAQARATLAAERGIELHLQVGIHTGVVIARALRRAGTQDAIDLVGPTPQVAWQLEALARPGEVLASQDTTHLLRREFEREPAPPAEIAELGGSVSVFRLTGMRQTAVGAETIQSERESPLVGRTAQVEQLVERWRQLQPGRGEVVLVTGEPGIGKSRLLRELRRHVPAEAWIGLQCAAENQNSPLRPFVDLFSAWGQPLPALLARYGMDDADSAALFAQLLSVPGDGAEAAPTLPPERRKEATLNALVTLIARMAAERPVVFAMEDLHWADPTSLEVVQLLIDELRAPQTDADAPRLYVVLTARPQFTPTWPIDNTLLLPLPHLTSQQVEEMVAANVDDLAALPRPVLDEVIARSDGIPLFAEEVTRVLLESGGDGGGGDRRIEIPATLRDLITARLDGVSPAARDTAQIASVLGREFRYEYLRAISLQAEAAVRSDVRELVNAGLLYQRRSARAESYLFKHALLRDVAYESMPRATRQLLHERAADTLRERFPDVERTQPEVLAHHYERGGQRASALEYWRLAGERAVARGAYVESIRHFEAGLAVIETLPRARRQEEAELGLRTALGVGLIATRGYGAEAVEHNYSRAQALCRSLDDTPQQLPALYGLWTYHLLRDHRDTPGELAERLYQIARAPEHVLIATATRGITAYFRAELPAAIVDLERATALYDIAHQRVLARELGQDAALLAPLYCIWCLAHLGRYDQARRQLEVVERMVAEVDSPYITATALIFGMLLGVTLEDVELTRGFAEHAITLSVEQRFPFFLATATCGLGWTQIMHDDVDTGIAKIQEGLGILAMTGAVVARSYWLACIAEGHLRRRDAAAGLAIADEGLALTHGNLNRLQDPWLHRVKGDLLALTADHAGAEQSLRAAAQVARASGDRSLELRAITSLTRLLRQLGRGEESRPLLVAVTESFSEGLDNRDLRDARALLAELS